MNHPKRPGTARSASKAGVAALLLLGLQIPVLAQDSTAAPASSDVIVASLNPVAEGQACSDAASQAQVSFDFQKPDFDIKQISLYVDGHGVAPDAVNQQWPRVTLTKGLHQGRNTVEIVATGDNDRSLARQLTVLIGAEPQSGDENAAVVQCDSSRNQVAATPPAASQPEQQTAQVPQTVIVPQTIYVQEPVYVYHTVPSYPVWPVYVPIIPVVIGYPPYPTWYGPRPYCPPPVVTYYPVPPYYRPPPPVAYKPPPYQPPAASNTWRTPNPITATPMPLAGTPTPYPSPAQPGGASRGPRGSVVYYSTQPKNDAQWGAVNQMNAGGTGTRYRTPAPQAPVPLQPLQQPYYHAAPDNGGHGQQGSQMQWAPAYPGNGGQMTYREPPHQSYVHEAPPPQRYEAPHPMSPPRMTAAPMQHPPGSR